MVRVEGKMAGAKYWKKEESLKEESLIHYARDSRLEMRFLPSNKTTTQRIQPKLQQSYSKLRNLMWPSQSSDLNHINILWSDFLWQELELNLKTNQNTGFRCNADGYIPEDL